MKKSKTTFMFSMLSCKLLLASHISNSCPTVEALNPPISYALQQIDRWLGWETDHNHLRCAHGELWRRRFRFWATCCIWHILPLVSERFRGICALILLHRIGILAFQRQGSIFLFPSTCSFFLAVDPEITKTILEAGVFHTQHSRFSILPRLSVFPINQL